MRTAQGLFNDKLPQYVDLLVAQDPRSQTEAEFLGALRHALNNHMGERGWVDKITPTLLNDGYRAHIVTKLSGSLFVGMSFDEMITLGEGAGDGSKGAFDRICGGWLKKLKEQIP